MCGSIFPEAINSRLIQPKLWPASPPAVLVITRPCQAGARATLAKPALSLRTISLVCFVRNAMSSPKSAPAAELRIEVIAVRVPIVVVRNFWFIVISLYIRGDFARLRLTLRVTVCGSLPRSNPPIKSCDYLFERVRRALYMTGLGPVNLWCVAVVCGGSRKKDRAAVNS